MRPLAAEATLIISSRLAASRAREEFRLSPDWE